MLLAATTTTPQILIKCSVKTKDDELNRTIMLGNQQTQFRCWTDNNLLLAGYIIAKEHKSARFAIKLGYMADGESPKDCTVPICFKELLSNSILDINWNERANIEARNSEGVLFSIGLHLLKTDCHRRSFK